jgi:nicotinate-nucleotide pyrophosphorylase (carboxylating)
VRTPPTEALASLLPPEVLDPVLRGALAEDRRGGDITSENAIPSELQAVARLVAKEHGVLAGLPVFLRTFELCDPECRAHPLVADSETIEPGQTIARVEGKARALLLAERTALNFLQRMCGIATSTARYVKLADGAVRILDTRKTTPGLRAFEKYAVCCGGGENHRFGLFDQVMIKDNHIDLSGLSVEELTRCVRDGVGPTVVMTVEARDTPEAEGAVRGGADVVLLDNMGPDLLEQLAPRLRELAMTRGREVQLEASGGIDETTAGRVATCGLDRISIGALTHSAPALDLSLYVESVS